VLFLSLKEKKSPLIARGKKEKKKKNPLTTNGDYLSLGGKKNLSRKGRRSPFRFAFFILEGGGLSSLVERKSFLLFRRKKKKRREGLLGNSILHFWEKRGRFIILRKKDVPGLLRRKEGPGRDSLPGRGAQVFFSREGEEGARHLLEENESKEEKVPLLDLDFLFLR